MKILFDNLETEKFFYNALCNSLNYLSKYGCEINYTKKDYMDAKKRLEKNPSLMFDNYTICYEDVLIEILRGGKTITCKDNENGLDDSIINLKDVHERMEMTPLRHLMDMYNEIDDADTADAILQTIFYKDVIFG